MREFSSLLRKLVFALAAISCLSAAPCCASRERGTCGFAQQWERYQQYEYETSSTLPLLVESLQEVVEVSVGPVSCVRQRDGQVKCWSDPSAPRSLALVSPAIALAAGTAATCVAHETGVSCLRHDLFLDNERGDAPVVLLAGIDATAGLCLQRFRWETGDGLGLARREAWACAKGRLGQVRCWDIAQSVVASHKAPLVGRYIHVHGMPGPDSSVCKHGESPSEEDWQEARLLAREAGRAYLQGEYDQGRALFLKLYSLTHSAAVLRNKAKMEVASGNLEAAIADLELYLVCEGDKDSAKETREQIEALRAKLGPSDLHDASTDRRARCPWRAEDSSACFAPDSQGVLTDKLKRVSAHSISDNGSHACGLVAGGQVWCVGSNYYGQLGDASREERSRPAPVVGITDAVQVQTAENRTCAVLRPGSVRCWGVGARSVQQPARGAILI